jgi:hypothetical protein
LPAIDRKAKKGRKKKKTFLGEKGRKMPSDTEDHLSGAEEDEVRFVLNSILTNYIKM